MHKTTKRQNDKTTFLGREDGWDSVFLANLASPKSLPLEKTQKHLVFFSLIRNFVGEILKKQRYMANTTPTAEDLLLSEEDIKLRYITPAITGKGWSVKDISMEAKVKLTDGKINLKGNLLVREKPKFADYLLFFNKATPIAIVEAKDATHSVSYGMQQAKEYADRMDIPFAFSSNGFGFQEYDFLTGKERTIPMDEFPSKEDLYARFLQESNGGAGFSAQELKVINQPYYSGQGVNTPRYYQRNAINRTVNAIARGQKRLLLVMV